MLKFSTAASFLGAAAVLCSLLLAGCGDGTGAGAAKGSGTAAGVIGGTEVEGASDPLAKVVVGLVMQSSVGESLCTGTLIAKDLVLTAAHCIPDQISSGQVQFGTTLGRQAEAHKIIGMVQHPKYEPDMEKPGNHFDIGLVRFEGKVPAGYVPAMIDANPATVVRGLNLQLMGYGLDSHFFHTGAGVLRTADFTIAELPNEGEIRVESSWNKALCNGDSGGGLFLSDQGKAVVVGVTSRTEALQFCKFAVRCLNYGIFTNVAANAEWIQQTGKDFHAADAPTLSESCLQSLSNAAQTAVRKKGQKADVFESPAKTPQTNVYSIAYWDRQGCAGSVRVSVLAGDGGACSIRATSVSPNVVCEK